MGYAGHVDDLYALPLSEFTAARDALAKELRAAGDKDAAAEVKALRKPTVGAWAVNQVVRDHPDLLKVVIASGSAIREALSSGDRDAIRGATKARRDAVAAATKAAVKLAGESHRDAIAGTFDAAAVDDAAAELVRAGRLTKELDAPSGFGLDDMPDLPAPRKPKVDKRAKEREEAEQRADEAEEHARELRRIADDAVAAAETAERTATGAREKANRLADD